MIYEEKCQKHAKILLLMAICLQNQQKRGCRGKQQTKLGEFQPQDVKLPFCVDHGEKMKEKADSPFLLIACLFVLVGRQKRKKSSLIRFFTRNSTKSANLSARPQKTNNKKPENRRKFWRREGGVTKFINFVCSTYHTRVPLVFLEIDALIEWPPPLKKSNFTPKTSTIRRQFIKIGPFLRNNCAN